MKKHIISISVLVFIDQVSKILARNFFDPPLQILNNFFQLKLVSNEGIAFSMPFSKIPLIALTIAVLIFLIIYLTHKKTSLNEQFAIILIFSGAVGNLIDRLVSGAVTDFLSFWTFPIFNFADIFITVGVVVFFMTEFRGKKKTVI